MVPPDEDRLRQEILRHMIRHPSARDTLEGITRFWISDQLIGILLSEVRTVVQDLVAEGLLRPVAGSPSGMVDASTLLELDPARCVEVQSMLNHNEEKSQ